MIRKKELFFSFFSSYLFVASCLKIKYILFKTTYPNIDILVLVYFVVDRQTLKFLEKFA